MQIEVGSVIRLYVRDTTPPKIKRFVVIAKSDDNWVVATLYFNSEVNETVFFTKNLKSLQLPLDSDGRDYLDHPSFLDCSAIHEKPLSKLKLNLILKNHAIIGKLSDDDLADIRDLVKTATTITPKIKKRYGFV